MNTTKNIISLIVGSYGLTLSSYLMYKEWGKKKWQQVTGYIDNVTLKYEKKYFIGTYYLNVNYYFYINGHRIKNNKEYKIYLDFNTADNIVNGNNSDNSNSSGHVKTNEYVEHIFNQASKEKNVNISYNSNNVNESEPLIYIYEKKNPSKYKIINKIKSKLVNLKTYINKLTDLNEVTNVFFHDASTKGKKLKEEQNGNKKNVENTKDEANAKNIASLDSTTYSKEINNNDILLKNNKRLINAYDINNFFPLYMFSCSFFLFLSFFFKKRIYFVRNKIMQEQQKKIK
ncbi:conserved protein, unknown function [Hepatocystis sp. ex Piliocolobus tephrosceles]|nr:conserved protein, unknown function [Hepatocystis sp. ex Piliocolobus tephrosceles]